MKRWPPRRCAALLALSCALFPVASAGVPKAQEESSPVAVLLGRARTLEQRGRLDLAKQDWAQVLQLQSDDAEALAGLVRAARAEGRPAEAAQLLSRLRSAHPKDPELARLEASGKSANTTAELAEAGRLFRAGDPRGALAIYRQVYGLTPPPGAPALAYFQAEAATDEGRPQAIAGLRALADRYPTDARYPVALGRILLAGVRTRAEGRTILERYPENAEAVAALHAATHPGDVASAPGDMQQRHPETALAVPPPTLSNEAPAHPLPKPSPATPMPQTTGTRFPAPGIFHSAPSQQSRAETQTVASSPHGPALHMVVAVRHGSYAAQEQAGFAALNQHRNAEAEQIFRGILARDPADSKALAGLGYLEQTGGDLKDAVTLFEQAQESGDRSLALTRALVNAQFDLALQQAGTARLHGDLAGAEGQYLTALKERPNDPEALEGLATVLLQSGRAAEAMPVFRHLTQVRPMSPGAWRGLLIAEASSGRGAAALETEARIPLDAKAPLLHDPSYLQALETARAAQGTQLAKNEPPASLRPASSPASHAAVVAPLSPAQQSPTVVAPPPAPQRAAVTPPLPTPVAPIKSAPPLAGAQQVPRVPEAGHATPPVPPAVVTSVAPAKSPAPASRSPQPASPPQQAAMSTPAPSRPGKVAKPGRPGSEKGKPSVNASVQPPVPAPVPPSPRPESNRAETIAAERTEQGNAALARGESARAADLFRDAIANVPERSEAWKGLVQSLHDSGRNAEAEIMMARVPDATRGVLERDATFQSMLGSVLLGADRPEEALHAFARAQDVFAAQKLAPPLDLVLRIATLLAARNDDGNLYPELLYLGSRTDLNDGQRRDVQMIWTSWAVRRARALAAAGEPRRAVTVLNAAAEAFAGNTAVLSAVAEGYAGVGLPREAVAIYKARDLASASERELEAAVSAGIAAHDYKAAQGWARLGRERFPASAAMLTTNAELEQARGHQDRAVELSRQAKVLAPAQDPGRVLTAELREAQAGSGWRPESAGKLSVLLAPAEAGAASTSSRPFLPGSEATANAGQGTPVLSGLDNASR